jgi:hypothetical protein
MYVSIERHHLGHVSFAVLNSLFAFNIGVKYDEADLSAALMTEIFPELQYSSDIRYVLPSKKALRRFPCATVLPRPLPDSLNAQSQFSDRIRRNLKEVADLAMRRVPALTVKLDRYLETNLEVDKVKWQTTRRATATRRQSYINDCKARVEIVRNALHVPNRTSMASRNEEQACRLQSALKVSNTAGTTGTSMNAIESASRSVEQGCHSRSTLKESSTAGTTRASMNAAERSNDRAPNPFNMASRNECSNGIPDSLIIPVTTLNVHSNNNANIPPSSHTRKSRFSIKLNWTRT